MEEKDLKLFIHNLSNNSILFGDLVFHLRHQIECVLNVGMPVKRGDREELQNIAEKLRVAHSDYCDIIVSIISAQERASK